ncbi:uncharacterized protein LOC110327547 [Mus pahari]|uniref:uncharacterized protein LOC110327547 n=1 Tax=Mus pahari TaxID=10093 RepID=UPI000A310593|nr:uncharacterized protein LOC110327547 [Mus pahari]
MDPLESVNVHLEFWVSKVLFGEHDSMPKILEDFLNTHVFLAFEINSNDTVLTIYGLKAFNTFAMFVIVSLACNLRIKRRRARAWARGLQSPVWWKRSYFI